jgi:potassium efflux system protein
MMGISITDRWQRFGVRFFCGVVLVLVLTMGAGWSQSNNQTPQFPDTVDPAMAQPAAPSDKGTKIVVNGLPLLQVAESSTESAQDRAAVIQSRITRNLDTWLTQDNAPQVSWETVGNSPVISIDDQVLLTVTVQDVSLNNANNTEALANTWESQIQSFLDQARQEQREGYAQKAILAIIGIVAAAAVGHWGVGIFWQRYLLSWLQRITFAQDDTASQGTFTVVNLFLSLTRYLVRGGIWCAAFFYSTGFFWASRQWSTIAFNALISSFTAEVLSIGASSFSVVDVMTILGMIFVIVLLARSLTNLLRSRVLQAAGINRGMQEAIAILTRYFFIVIGVIVVLQLWGLDLSSLALLASALGIGIGLGLQNIAKDIGSGLVLVFERPIQVGDFIEFGSQMGTVERIGIRSTEVRTLDHVSIIVPNSRFLDSDVINWSHGNPLSRIHIPVGVAYKSDPEAVRSILLSVGRQHPDVVVAPAPQVFFKGFGDNALEFDLLVWIRTPSRQIVIKSDLNFAIATAFQQNNIEIPFPQRDLHLINGDLPIGLNAETQTLLQQILKSQ